MQVSLENASKSGILLSKDKSWYPIKFYHGTQIYKAKIKIRGDYSNHWAGQKKSWRIKFNKTRLFQGRKYLDLIIPSDKRSEHIAYKFARKHKLLVPDSGYATVAINAVNMGLYFWLEKPSKQMLEKQEMPDGEIFRTGHAWSDAALNGGGLFNTNMHNFHYSANFNPTIHKKDHKLSVFTHRWNSFLDLITNASDKVFEEKIGHFLDLNKYYYWNAITWLFGSLHSHSGDNLKWFYNSTSGKFEPLLYDIFPKDIQSISIGNHFESSEYDLLAIRLFKIAQHRLHRNQTLYNLISESEHLANALEDLYFQLRPLFLSGAGANFTDFAILDTYFYRDIHYIKSNYKFLKKQLENARVFIQTDLISNPESQTLNISIIPDTITGLNFSSFSFHTLQPIQIESFKINDKKINFIESKDKLSSTLNFPPLFLDINQSKTRKILPKIHKFTLTIKNTLAPSQLNFTRFSLQNPVNNKKIPSSQQFLSPLSYKNNQIETITLDPLKAIPKPFQLIDNHFYISKGTHIINKNYIIPAKYELILKEGAKILMAPNTSLLIQNTLKAYGTSRNPVQIQALEINKPFGNILVVNSPNTSKLTHLYISGGSESYINGIFASGQLSFFHADVDLSYCKISNAHGDDGLNIKYSSFSINNSLFYNNSSDGFDGDFVVGTISNSKFLQNKGDGIDTSGAYILIERSIIDGMVDKGISAGEKSTLFVVNTHIKNNLIGIASKDFSKVSAFNTQFSFNKKALSLYQKKQIFGPAFTSIQNSIFTSNTILIDKDKQSISQLQNNLIDQSSLLKNMKSNLAFLPKQYTVSSSGLLSLKKTKKISNIKKFALPKLIGEHRFIYYHENIGVNSNLKVTIPKL
ncbi:CotH kinase family protein [bacterium]|nr:CotH kinase family protein [bacterium]